MRSYLLLFALCACHAGPAPTPPAKTMTHDRHSFARPDQVAVRHVALDLSLDFDRRIAAGTCTLSIDRTDPDAPLMLDSSGLDITEVRDAASGTPLSFSLGEVDAILGQALRIELAETTTRVAIQYATRPEEASAMQWLTAEQTSGSHPFLFTQGQSILTRSWIPLQDSPGVRVTWNATIHAPKSLRPLMSAIRSGGNAGQGWTFDMDKPVPSYLIALACGDLVKRDVSDRCAVWAEPAVVDKATAELEDMERMLSACEELFGPYRWERYDVLILPPAFPFGGMENPCLTFATPTILAGDKSLVALIAHELAHSWSGNLVTNATWRDFWLNEGFTVYLEQRIMEHVYGVERAKMEIALAMRGLAAELRRLPEPDQVLHVDLTGRNPDDGMTAVPYDKGAALLRRLEEVIGRAEFDALLRSWFDTHAFQSVTTADFEEWLSRQLLAEQPNVARQVDLGRWIHAGGLPADAPTPHAAAFEPVDAARQQVAEQKNAAALADCDDWTTQQWLRFLDGLPADATLLTALDEARDFTDSGNSEILAAWLAIAIAADYQPAMPRLKQFLLEVGRRKFLVPLYKALLAAPNGKARAMAIYRQARPRYHSVSTNTLDKLLDWQGP